mgnify:CR=1 FL=1|jgi:hypothetical protein|tara:strand:- start:380 stop:2539 length:2160 start_codon:yes stop_codon:yes gene_type:complete
MTIKQNGSTKAEPFHIDTKVITHLIKNHHVDIFAHTAGVKGINGHWKNKQEFPSAAAATDKKNYHIRTGFGNIVDIDIDFLKRYKDQNKIFSLVNVFLPYTGVTFGRNTTPHSHHLFNVTDLAAEYGREKYTLEGTILEIRAHNHYSMCNGTYAETDGGGYCRFYRTADPAKVTFKDLKRSCNELALAAALFEKAPAAGARHDYWNIVAGTLHWQKGKKEWIYSFLERIIDVTERWHDRKKSIENLLTKTKKIPGHKTLIKNNYFTESEGKELEELIFNCTGWKKIEPLKLHTYTGNEVLESRPWVIPGWLMRKCLTVLAGQPGVGKTMLLHMIAYGLVTGRSICGKQVIAEETGNVLIVAAEETHNEIRLRIKAIEQHFMQPVGNKHKIFYRGLESDLKLVRFTLSDAKPTLQYHQLKRALLDDDIKYIILDPLINFATGNYEENSNEKMERYVKDYLIPIAVEIDGAMLTGHHTNKLSMVDIMQKELVIDHQNAMFSARGASSLVAAARFVIGMQPMTRKLFEHFFKDYIPHGNLFTQYAALIEGKSNYNLVGEDCDWVLKQEVVLDVTDPRTGKEKKEKLGVLTTTDLNKIHKSRNKLKAAANESWVKTKIPAIKAMMAQEKDTDSISANKVVEVLIVDEADYGNEEVPDNTIKTRVRRKLFNGLRGQEQDSKKGGMASTGIEYEDGYNFWLEANPKATTGNAKWFIKRGKDFKRS